VARPELSLKNGFCFINTGFKLCKQLPSPPFPLPGAQAHTCMKPGVSRQAQKKNLKGPVELAGQAASCSGTSAGYRAGFSLLRLDCLN